jgi:hypothetical protein
MIRLRAVVSVLALLLCTSGAFGQLVNGRLVTSFYAWEQYDTVGTSSTILRAYQLAQFSVAYGDFSVHTYLQGAMNGTSEFGDLGIVRAYNLYARWSNIGRVLDVSLGRQAVYAGVGTGTIDGMLLRGTLLDKQLFLTAYGGATVRSDFRGVRDNWKDNYNTGAQVLFRSRGGLRLGASYMNRHLERQEYETLRTRDTTFAAYPYQVAPESQAEQYLSGDVAYARGKAFSIYGRYDYDLNFSRTSRVEGGARVNLTERLTLLGDYFYRVPRVAYNSIFSAFVANAVSEIEGGLEYAFLPRLRAFARLAWVSYEGDDSKRWTVGLNNAYGSISYSGSDGYAGQLQSLSVWGSYPVLHNLLVPNLGVSYASYRFSAGEDRQDAISVLLGTTVRPFRTIWFDVQGQWLTNRVYSGDLRVQAKLTYWFSERLSGS